MTPFSTTVPPNAKKIRDQENKESETNVLKMETTKFENFGGRVGGDALFRKEELRGRTVSK